ncbi:MAG TPA: hypothetical protein VL025_01980, partial [Thermoanaerobaculia bacterium]|nr:hypothetical protein [Thermoanaerobaculia bacterium]
MSQRFPLPAAAPAWVLSLALLASPATAAVDSSLLAGMKARSVGPATMSGRVAAIDASVKDPDLIWVGAATGGVWKSTNGGLSWEPVFDDQPFAAIGAVAIDQNSPDVVWVGTGEGNPRNSVSVGGGIYRTLDGGRTWKLLGLEKTERIHRIVLHPSDPQTAWAGAMGQAWGENPERGVFKTDDGGKSWRKVLYVDERTGVADLVADPSNPNKMIAAMWDYRRWPWFFRSGGPGSGLFITHDGGESWTRLTEEDGLPKGHLGRSGVAFAPSDPRIVYALVEAEKNALLRSDDGGRTWKTVNSDNDVSPRPFYYADIRVDPSDPNRIYRLGSSLDVSTDGGKSFSTLAGFGSLHPDHHAMWINPNDPTHIWEGNDGGVAVSRDRGATWNFAGNLPVGQFYHVRVDMERPYNLYGGMQDNGSWKGPNTAWEQGGIRNHHWSEVGFGDGFDTAPDPRDPMRGYAMSQQGFLMRWDLRTGERKDIRPAPAEGDDLRFNWNAAFAIDPFEPDTIYYGSQYVHKSTDRGDTWTIISPDLTSDNPAWQKRESGGLTPDVTGAEGFTTITAIDASKVQRGVIWAGSDDGRVHVTRDGGKSWESTEKNLRGVPANTWVPHVRASKFDAASAFVVMDNHRRDDWTPYVFRTDDWGKTWKSLATRNIRGYALAIDQDPVDEDLLFLGTEFGLYVSNDGGGSWMKWKHGLPETVSAMDLVVHPRDHDLVVATHGRAVYVIDDIAPLREISAETMREPLHLYPSSAGMLAGQGLGSGNRRGGAGEFRGESRPRGVLLTWSLNVPGLPLPDDKQERERKEKERAEARRAQAVVAAEESEPGPGNLKEDPPRQEETAGAEAGEDGKGPKVKIQIADSSGKVIRTFEAPARQGLNRAVWDLGRDPFRAPPTDSRGNPRGQDESGPEVPPGTYGVTVRYRDHEAK